MFRMKSQRKKRVAHTRMGSDRDMLTARVAPRHLKGPFEGQSSEEKPRFLCILQ